MFLWLDPYYVLYVMLPALVLGGLASLWVKSAFARASKIGSQRGWTGRQIAEAILQAEGIDDVRIEPTQGYLSDHYDPREKVLRLSPDVYQGRSLASAGVAAHEVGHAIQHAHGYAPLALRSAVVPVASFGSSFGMILAFIGIGMAFQTLAAVGCALFSMVVLFQIVNLPVEFNASRRALQMLTVNGLVVSSNEAKGVKQVLDAAALTYVAALAQALSTLLYYVFLLTGFSRQRD